MRIGLLLPAVFSLNGPGNGTTVQAQRQADALAGLGHDVVRLNAWTPYEGPRLDVVHGVVGGFPLHNFQYVARNLADRVGLAPILDTNEPIWRYRLAAKLGRLTPKVFTTPGELALQAGWAHVVVCRSESERRRVVHGLGVPAAKAKIVLNGVGPPPTSDPARARALVGFDGDFVLHLSAYCQPRKNVVRLIEAVGPTKIPLVIAGTPENGPTLAKIKTLCERYPSVRRLEFQSAADRDALLAACRVLALPSEHEGTGLAALEAASAGAAVVITERGGARDYFRDLAAYVDPHDTPGIGRAVQATFAQPRSTMLAEHVRANLTWEHSARRLAAALSPTGGDTG